MYGQSALVKRYQMFKLSVTAPNLCSKQPPLHDQSFDQWLSAGCLTNRHSDHQMSPQLINISNVILIDPLL